MKAKFQKSNTESQHELNTIKLEVRVIKNRDGSLRWAWPLELKEAHFLKFYSSDSFRSHVFAFAIKAIFFFRLQSFFFSKSEIIDSTLFNTMMSLGVKGDWALFFGTKGLNQKKVLYFETAGVGNFVKIADSEKSMDLLWQELNNITYISQITSDNLNQPEIIGMGKKHIQLSDISKGGKRVNEFTKLHLESLKVIHQNSLTNKNLFEMEEWFFIKMLVHDLSCNSKKIPKGIIEKLDILISDIDSSTNILTSFAHRDFTPWNMFVNGNSLNVYDWELAKEVSPVAYDAFHFIIQNGILNKKSSWTDIKKEIEQKLDSKAFYFLTGVHENDVDLYLKLYLIFHTTYYLNLYEQQENWHEQIYWQINTWNDALSDLLQNELDPRQSLIKDTFDYLSHIDYAALKFPNIPPEELPLLSDIDLCIRKQDAIGLVKYLKSHSLVAKCRVNKLSFMSSVLIHLIDGSLFALDLNWQIKRKDLQFMDVEKILDYRAFNKYGVSIPRLSDDVTYIGLFYALNNKVVPSKYTAYRDLFKYMEAELNEMLFPCFFEENSDFTYIRKEIKEKTWNTGFSAIQNKLKYALDCLKRVVSHKGFIVTFSGVDGSGKSTVIEEVALQLEKKFRKRVVVLRHRPSLLPILSSWVKGKEKAEQDAATNPPRQGNNKSTISSLFRFSYYYCDYLFGQVYVYGKYIMRGYVVLYDRYYFDFINDPERSNIKLPQFVSKAGFLFIKKPDLNFLLHHNAEEIYKRKPELDKKSIKELNMRYIKHFTNLAKKDKNKYLIIENNTLSQTLEQIINKIKLAA